jgi:cell division protein FtsI (penicillin-binding protein 3)
VGLIERRVGLLFALFVLLFALAIGRAAWIQAVQGASLSADARLQQTQTLTIPGQRGAILDRRGNELAVSEDAADVIATPYQVDDPARAAQRLAGVLHVPEQPILESLANDSSGFAYVDRQADLPTAEKVRRLHLAGISTVPDSRRVYPEGQLASQVIGSVGVDGNGLTGLEAAQNDLLAGANGERRAVLDGLGKELERETIQPPERGGDLQLTIDAGLQGETQRVLDSVAATFKPRGATAIVMDPRNSRVLAMAQWPTADPSDPASADPLDLQNMATGFTYEPGSTFKGFTIAGALQDGVVTPRTTFDLPVSLQVADRTITDAEERGPETLTVSQILKYSSNVGAATIGMKLNAEKGNDRFDHWVRKFGFGAPTGIDFPGEEQGIVLTPDEYSGSTMGNLPIGQGLSVTPIQMATAYSAIADGGVLHQPRLILRENGESVPAPKGHRVIGADTAAKLRKMLEGVLAPGGTASEVSVPGYTLAGKTGTAQKVVDGQYSHTQFVASFVGFAPAEDPRLLVAVVVDEPSQVSYYGGAVAAPAFGEIAKFALPYLHIPPDEGPAATTP